MHESATLESDTWGCIWHAVRLLLALAFGGAGLLAVLIGGVLIDAAFNGFCLGVTMMGESCSEPTGFDAVLLLPPAVAALLMLFAARLIGLSWRISLVVSSALPAMMLVWIVVAAR